MKMISENVSYIYALFDPRNTEHIRYIGQSVNPTVRLRRHKYDARTNNYNHKERWVSSLIAAGVEVGLVILQCCKSDSTNDCETQWIRHFKDSGHDLTNARAEGEYKFTSEETREKIRQANTGRKHSDSMREKRRLFMLSDANTRRGVAFTEEHKKKLGVSKQGELNPMFGKKASEACISKLKEMFTGVPLKKEHKEKISESKRASWKAISQHSLEGEFIKNWESISKASHETGIPTGNISKCCKGGLRKTGGFIWKYRLN